ncbi:winged helix-turn-helix domain-containing protein [Candidatus Nitrosotenuis sp. DW1]|uniref:winged helix-turn-helix domain-containing protein n=1 Tax=Candidatus Nitrosotenuis sp. DW1 TaxID=2259672 RepID=UPI0021066234|nr:winged helix-turn-helix domain-containing protein [Candidatus Nitrosotenuis sp. DW1]
MMAKQQYRSEIGILNDILGVIADSGRNGVGISAITRAANVSHSSVNEKCQKLVDANLVNAVKDDRGNTFFITESGIIFLEQLRRFTQTMKSMNIRY